MRHRLGGAWEREQSPWGIANAAISDGGHSSIRHRTNRSFLAAEIAHLVLSSVPNIRSWQRGKQVDYIDGLIRELSAEDDEGTQMIS
jgi:hypothetical protein